MASNGSLPAPGLQDFSTAAETATEGEVDVAAREVWFDETRGLWAADVAIDAEVGERPFVRLALARYQPVAVAGLALSDEVQPDPVRLGPRRRVRVQQTAVPGRLICAMDFAPADHRVQVRVQQADPAIADADLRWHDLDLPSGPALAPLRSRRVGGATRYRRRITIPATVTGDVRLVFEDFQPVTRTESGTGNAVADDELVYRETVEIPAAWRA